MKMIVGLGNPGRQYAGTRHNVGFEVIQEMVRRWGTGSGRSNFQGEVFEATVEGERVLLLMPFTFMNLSGTSVQAARAFHKIEVEDLLIVCDDLNLPTGQLRFRANGSAGGQKGLSDVILKLGTDKIPRLKIGIDRPLPGRDVSAYVLGKFTSAEQFEIDLAIRKGADGVRDWIVKGLPYCMNQYNQAESAKKPPRAEKDIKNKRNTQPNEVQAVPDESAAADKQTQSNPQVD